jgi:hypothetical protein
VTRFSPGDRVETKEGVSGKVQAFSPPGEGQRVLVAFPLPLEVWAEGRLLSGVTEAWFFATELSLRDLEGDRREFQAAARAFEAEPSEEAFAWLVRAAMAYQQARGFAPGGEEEEG